MRAWIGVVSRNVRRVPTTPNGSCVNAALISTGASSAPCCIGGASNPEVRLVWRKQLRKQPAVARYDMLG
jgi:hypothetical protein